jgi:hypothetical protein
MATLRDPTTLKPIEGALCLDIADRRALEAIRAAEPDPCRADFGHDVFAGDGRERASAMKRRVVMLHALGLVALVDPGYVLTPRGRELLERGETRTVCLGRVNMIAWEPGRKRSWW